ncbi:rhamnogalacturonan lyase [Novosphingobium profundi]|uniref:rhamnogalacturonan lyase n=1 Tax=Novosphingobium profundi TaxID=1774954 RepID=UPI001BDA2825|nr:rhamnogalacturonan lyase [Novosphingobium profundi]MBT0669557.1 rhamnogalacturonan lyase [Novosphingobium profundi]
MRQIAGLRWVKISKKFQTVSLFALSLGSTALLAAPQVVHASCAPEPLTRGAVALPAVGGGILVSWRLLADDPVDARFEIRRNGKVIHRTGRGEATAFRYAAGSPSDRYEVVPGNGRTAKEGVAAPMWAKGYLSIPLSPPPEGVTPDGQRYGYTANDASLGDLDGDGNYEIVLKWDPTNSHDNSQSGYTGDVYLDAYTLDGTRLWRIDLGRNIRAGAHYTQFLVYDFDGDGRSEIALKTADGTVDGVGRVLGDAAADWRSHDGEVPQADRTGAKVLADGTKVAVMQGRIVRGPEYLTVFEGATGRALASAPYDPPRYPGGNPTPEELGQSWGDGYANRSDRFLAGVACLDGAHPSMVFGRGYYARTALAAWDWREGKLTERWLFDSSAPGNEDYGARGNHQLSVADVDGDGRDEIVYGSMAIDDDGKGLWTQPLYHGDAMHVSDLDPARPGLEKFSVFEDVRRNGHVGSAMMDARTGEVLWSKPAENDTGRGLAADIDPRHYGVESWGSNSDRLFDVHGQSVGPAPRQTNFAIWWDGDLLRELLDKTTISKWNWETGKAFSLLSPLGLASNNSTKATPALQADILGDWREEVVWRSADNRELRVYTTPWPTAHRFVTLMHDPQYRLSVAWQNTAYNQPPHPGFYIGAGPEGQR